MFKATPSPRSSTSSNEGIQSADELDGVQLRHGTKSLDGGGDDRLDHEPVTYENTSVLSVADRNGKLRHSDSHAINEYSNIDVAAQRTAQRKYHSKSFSLSENRVAANLNVFKQNRELWEKRTEMQSTHSLTAPRILTRNRIAPDLVMDLPVSNNDRAVNRSRESLDSSDEATADAANAPTKISNGGGGGGGNDAVVNSKSIEDMTTAERFATQNQCTLKKNERFSAIAATNADNGELHKENVIDGKASTSGGSIAATTVLGNRSSGPIEKPKAEIKPQESTLLKDLNRTSDPKADTSATNLPALLTKEMASIKPNNANSNSGTGGTATKDLQHKSPIPTRNTQKFVSQFADLKLTGGCLSSTSNTTPINTVTDACGTQQSPPVLLQQQQSTSLSSFKPQVKVKPQILRKPLVLPPTTPETVRRNQD